MLLSKIPTINIYGGGESQMNKFDEAHVMSEEEPKWTDLNRYIWRGGGVPMASWVVVT